MRKFLRWSEISLLIILFCTIGQQNLQAQKSSKVSSDLLELAGAKQATTRLKSQQAPKSDVAALFSKNNQLQIRGEYVVVEAIASKDVKSLIADLKTLGLKEEAVYGGMVSGLIPLKAIQSMEGIASLKQVKPAFKPITNSGITTTYGDYSLRSINTRMDYGVDGKGVTIGVLSDSYDNRFGAESGIASGDLPGANNPFGYTDDILVLQDADSNNSDEGRAMLEILHDVAPGAKLAFHTANGGQAAFAQGIIALAEAGCEVITDDIAYLTEPYFQDGVIAQAVDEVVKDYGVTFYSSAGNNGRQSYESEYRSGTDTMFLYNPYSNIPYGNYFLHDFDPGPGVDYYQEVIFYPNGGIRLALQWDEPFASVCENCPGAANDLDIFLAMEESPYAIVLESAYSNLGTDAVEILSASYGGTDTISAYIMIGKWLDTDEPTTNPNRIKYIDFGDYTMNEYKTNSPTCFGHSNSKKVNAVGAAFWYFTPRFGTDPAEIHEFSSVGGSDILFNTKGKRYKRPIVRRNPDFTATDGGNTTFFGQQINDGDNFPNFFGTSAAAPHAAGVAALLKQVAGEKVSSRTIEYMLKSTALDMDDAYTSEFDKGFDFKTGKGLIQADAAMKELIKRVGLQTVKVEAMCSNDPDSARSWKIVNPNPYNVTVKWEILGTSINDSLIAKAGETYFETPAQPWYNVVLISYTGPWGETRKYAAYSNGKECTDLKVAESTLASNELFIKTSLYPNPSINKMAFEFFTSVEKDIIAEVYNVNGELVSNQYFASVEGFNSMEVRVEDLTPGMYILKVKSTNGAILEQMKFVKQ
ncbi:MAG: S8 family serine peptidase [Bacteroidales bacterium]|nr:S8 family serine peptidase [Bacteroidales bacterium]